MRIPKYKCTTPMSACSGAQDRELLRQYKAYATAPGPMAITGVLVGCVRPEQVYKRHQNLYLFTREADSPPV